MSLPRVVVRVHKKGDTGWSVRVVDDWTGEPLVDDYDMEAVDAVAEGRTQRVPTVPAARRTASGDSHDALCAGDLDALTRLLGRMADGTTRADDVIAYGRWLFECLLAPAWPVVSLMPPVIAARGVELALELPVDAVDLNGLVWEAMHDGTTALAGHRTLLVALSRLVPHETRTPEMVTRLPRVLFAVGAALTDEVIRPGAMFMGLVRAFDADGLCQSQLTQDVTVADLAELCSRLSPDVVHLVAHGRIGEGGRGALVLGERRPGGGMVDAQAVATALAAGAQGPPTAVVISACKSGVTDGRAGAPFAVELVTSGVPIVSAMAGEVSEQACRLYTRRFVEALHAGESVVEAAAKGRRAALLTTETPSDQPDWAFPALFLSASVPPTFQAIDPTATNALIELGQALEVQQKPLFIGRADILSLVEEVFAGPGRRLGFVGIVREGPIQGLGGTRLLREIGFTALRAGHLPLLLGPYSSVLGDGGRQHGMNTPQSLRKVVTDILCRAVKVAALLRMAPPPISTLSLDRTDAASTDPAGVGRGPADDASTDPNEAQRRAYEGLYAFEHGHASLDPRRVKMSLAQDLAAFARRVGEVGGEPFGAHTRALVLCDEVHAWSGAVEPLMSMVDSDGLGMPGSPVPLVVTASLLDGSGATVREFRESHVGIGGYAFPELTTLAPLEATLGFQWVLLHPWRRDKGPDYRNVYTRSRTTPSADVHSLLSMLGGMPTAVEERLYDLAGAAYRLHNFVAADDEQAYADYLRTYG